MISNAADAERQGLTQGTNQSISALFRAIGPFVAGAIFSFSVTISFPFLLYWFLGAVNLACLMLLRALPPHGIIRVSEERPSAQEMQQLAHKSENGSERHAEPETESEPVLEVVRDEDQNNDSNHKERN